jgi:hypothetical protein
MTKNYIPQQTSKWFPRQIQRYGCYFLSILYGACSYLDKKLKPSQVLEIFEQAIEKEYMTFSCYVKNPAKIGTLGLEILGSKDRFYYVGSERDGKLDIYNEALYDSINHTVDNIQIMWEDKKGSLRNGSHFVTQDYNPDTRLIPTGKIFGHRYFKIGEPNDK